MGADAQGREGRAAIAATGHRAAGAHSALHGTGQQRPQLEVAHPSLQTGPLNPKP